jgi:two-component system chemotaxis response regulator CheY
MAAAIEVPSILITDDDAGFRETLRGVFEPEGYRTLTAGDGEEALDIVRRDQVHLLLLDVHMPRLTGLQVVERLRQFQLRLPCILMSAALDEEISRQARLLEAFSVLAKPVSRQRLTLIVAQAMRVTYNWPLAAQ